MFIQTEATPNPATVKFLPGRAVMDSGTRDFADHEEAEASPLAEALFGLGDVTGVHWPVVQQRRPVPILTVGATPARLARQAWHFQSAIS